MFIANSQNDLEHLQHLKSKFKMLAGSVIQDVYNILQSTQCVEEILALCFPAIYQKNTSTKEVLPFKGVKQAGTKEAWKKVELVKQQSQTFWTEQLIFRFMGTYRAGDKRQDRNEAQEAFVTFKEQEQAAKHEIFRLRKAAQDARRRNDIAAMQRYLSELEMLNRKME